MTAQGARPDAATYNDHADRNGLLNDVGEDLRVELERHVTVIRFSPGTPLARAGEAIGDIYFPCGGVLAIGAKYGDRLTATGLIGREGYVGWSSLSGCREWPHDVIVRACETVLWRIDRTVLLDFASRYPKFHEVLLRGVETFMQQMAQTIASNLTQSVEQRTARWIAMYHERIEGDELVMTHRELGIMLGVRRSSITDALHGLEERGAIRGRRGRVLVREAQILKDVARFD